MKLNSTVIFVLLAVCQISTLPAALAQSPEIVWSRTYGGIDSDIAYSVSSTSDGGYIFAGDTKSFLADSNDVYLVKTDSLGNEQWHHLYGGSDYDDARSVQQTTDGGYVCAGRTRSFGAGGNDIYLIKTDGEGDTMWTRTYGGINVDYAESAMQTTDAGYIIAGSTRPYAGAIFEIYLVKTNSLGDTLWTRTYDHENGWKAYSVQQTSDDGYIIAGHNAYYSGVEYDIYLLRTDSLGDSLWTRTYGGGNDDFVTSVKQTTDGGYILTGWTWSFGAGVSDMYVVKTDSLGDTLWTHTYGGEGGETASSIQQTPDGGYIISGGTNSYGDPDGDLYLVKIDAIGDTVWTLVYGGPDSDYGYCVDLTSDGGYIIAGAITTFVPPYSYLSDCWLVKTGPDTAVSGAPVIQWVSHPKEFALHHAYPNPFNPTTTISFDVPFQSHVNLNIYNILGKRIGVLMDRIMPQGIHKVRWDGSAYPSGIYFIKASAGEFVQTRKVLLLK